MTARQVYEGVLIEMNKVQAPSLLLEDFNYLFNKAINLYINKRYNIYDVNQQTTDDLRVLKASALLKPKKADIYEADSGVVISANALYGATYEVLLPLDYLHILNCICNYKVKKQIKCYDKNTYVQFGATRLTSDMWSLIINNFYMKPSYKKPYYFIHNVNIVNNESVPTNPYNALDMQPTGFGSGTDIGLNSAADLFLLFLKDHPDYAFSVKSGYISASVENETLIPEKGTYYIATKDGVVYCVLFNVITKHFSFELETTTDLGIASEEISVITTGTNIKVIGESLFINNKEVNSPYVLVNSELLSKLAKETTYSGLPREIKTPHGDIDLIEKNGMHRYGNATNIRLEIRYGKDDSIFLLDSVYVDYIKTPLFIRLTLEQIDLTEDTSQVMEFPDYVCQEIINELTMLLMENSSDQRTLGHVSVSQSIANPAQALAQS